MTNGDRYPSVTHGRDHTVSAPRREWGVEAIEVSVSTLEVVRDPDRVPQDVVYRDDPEWRAVLMRSPEGRFLPRPPFGIALLTRDTLPQLRADLLDTDPRRVESVQRFLTRWGLLNLREGFVDGALISGGLTDDVQATRRWIEIIQRWLFEPMEALPQAYRALAAAGSRFWPMGTVRLQFLENRPMEARVQVFGLLDALLMALPVWLEDVPPRRCANPNCNGGSLRLIAVPRPGQSYCKPSCGTADRQRRFKLKTRALNRLEAGDTIAAVARRYRIDPTELRKWRKARTVKRRTRRKR